MNRIAMLLLVLCLAACGGAKTDERDTAAGKILPGSISDAMLQTDRLQSEAPLAAPVLADEDGDAKPKGAKSSGDAEKADADAAPEAEAPATPVASPASVPIPATPPAQ